MACLFGTACHDATKPHGEPPATVHSVSASVTPLAPAPGRFVLGSGGAAVWYNTTSRVAVGNVLRPDKATIVATAAMPSQTAVASAYRRLDQKCLSVVESETIDRHGNLRLGTFPKIGIEPATVTAIAVSPDGRFLAVGELGRGATAASGATCMTPHLVVIDLTARTRRESSLPWAQGLPIAKLAWSSDDRTIEAAAPASSGGTLDLWSVDQPTVGGSLVINPVKLSRCSAADIASSATQMLVLLSAKNCSLGRGLATIDPKSGAVAPMTTFGDFPPVNRLSADRTGSHVILFEAGQPAVALWDGGTVTVITTPLPGPVVAAAW